MWSKWRMLWVTSVAPATNACAAMRMSYGPDLRPLPARKRVISPPVRASSTPKGRIDTALRKGSIRACDHAELLRRATAAQLM